MGDRHPLLYATGQLLGQRASKLGQPNNLQAASRLLAPRPRWQALQLQPEVEGDRGLGID